MSNVPLSRSKSSQEALLKTMQKHKKLKSQIEGHDNGCCDILIGETSEETTHKISEKRADAIARFLIKNGIASDRLGTVGFGLLVLRISIIHITTSTICATKGIFGSR